MCVLVSMRKNKIKKNNNNHNKNYFYFIFFSTKKLFFFGFKKKLFFETKKIMIAFCNFYFIFLFVIFFIKHNKQHCHVSFFLIFLITRVSFVVTITRYGNWVG